MAMLLDELVDALPNFIVEFDHQIFTPWEGDEPPEARDLDAREAMVQVWDELRSYGKLKTRGKVQFQAMTDRWGWKTAALAWRITVRGPLQDAAAFLRGLPHTHPYPPRTVREFLYQLTDGSRRELERKLVALGESRSFHSLVTEAVEVDHKKVRDAVYNTVVEVNYPICSSEDGTTAKEAMEQVWNELRRWPKLRTRGKPSTSWAAISANWWMIKVQGPYRDVRDAWLEKLEGDAVEDDFLDELTQESRSRLKKVVVGAGVSPTAPLGVQLWSRAG